MMVIFVYVWVFQELVKEGVILFNKFWVLIWFVNVFLSVLLFYFILFFIMIICVLLGDVYNFIVNVEGYVWVIFFFVVVIGLFIF